MLTIRFVVYKFGFHPQEPLLLALSVCLHDTGVAYIFGCCKSTFESGRHCEVTCQIFRISERTIDCKLVRFCYEGP